MHRATVLLVGMVLVAAACGDSGTTTTTVPAPPPSTTATSATTLPTTTSTTATTAPAATTTTSPATTTTTTLPPTTTVPPTTTTTQASQAVPQLRGDGIGVAAFGADAEDVLALLKGVLGEPQVDDGWQDALDAGCAGTVVRFPQWDGFFAILTDAETAYGPAGFRHFAFWGAFAGSPLSTPEGLAPEVSTLGDVEELAGPVTPEYDELFDLYLFEVADGDLAGIEFEVVDPEDPAAVIVGMSAGERAICGE